MNNLKYYILILVAGIAIGYFLIPNTPKIVKEVRTVESKYWKAEYTTLQTKYTKDIAKNIKTTIITHIEYKDGKISSSTVTSDTLDLTLINSAKTETKTTTISIKGETVEKEIIKYSVYPLELSVGGHINISQFALEPISHAGIKYFWINNNIGSGIDYNWKLNYIAYDLITIRL